jgi:amidohydrolase
LPVHEETGLPYASKIAGKMHACGHDAHTVIALGVAAALSELRGELHGRIKFIFQPAEETLSGAVAMIKDGVLDDAPKMDVILGYHNWPLLKAGAVGFHPENVMASADAFDLTIKGRGGHAAHPHLAIDALVAAAHFVTQAQTVVSREIAPLSAAVLSIGELHAGTARNVVASEAVLKASVRTQEAGLSDKIEAAVRRLLRGIEESMRVETDLKWQRMTPVLRNDKAILERVLNVARDVLGPDNVVNLNQASMGSEDYAWFAEKIPSAHLRIGSKIEGLDTAIHRSNYDCHDLTIPTGVKVVASAALDLAKG